MKNSQRILDSIGKLSDSMIESEETIERTLLPYEVVLKESTQ